MILTGNNRPTFTPEIPYGLDWQLFRASAQRAQKLTTRVRAHPSNKPQVSSVYSDVTVLRQFINPLKPELNPICYLLALLGAHHFLHVSRIRVKSLTFRRLMSYIYGAPILDVSRSHTTTQHSR